MRQFLAAGTRRAVAKLVGMACMAIFLIGCTRWIGHFTHIPHEELDKSLRDIQTIALEEKSRTRPVSVEDASAEIASRVTETKPAPESTQLTLPEVRAAAL